jgi:predicted DNA-binding transcriptional regulator AlpA
MNEKEFKEEPVLLPPSEVARILQISTRTLSRLRAADKIVGPIRVGHGVRWRKDELLKWIEAGCPPRSEDKGST